MKTQLAKTTPPPTDRAIWLVANIIAVDVAFHSARTFEGYAKWSDGHWIGKDNLALTVSLEDEVHPLEWMELKERAAIAPPDEMMVCAHVYHFDSEWRRASGAVGFFASCMVTHEPTCVSLVDRCDGPFATQAEALDRLVALVGSYRIFGAASGEREEAA